MTTRTVEIRAQLHPSASAGPAAWMARTVHGPTRGLFAFGATPSLACHALATAVSMSLPTARAGQTGRSGKPAGSGRPAGPGGGAGGLDAGGLSVGDVRCRAVRVWADALYCHDGLDPHRTVTLPAVLVRDPLGQWLATIRPGTEFAGEVVSVADTADTALEDLALIVADAYASGAIAGAAAVPTRVRLVYARAMTSTVRAASAASAGGARSGGEAG